MVARWYVVHVYSGFEKKVAGAIREQAVQKGLDPMIEDVLVPAVPATCDSSVLLIVNAGGRWFAAGIPRP